MIAGVVYTGDKFIAGDNDAGDWDVWGVYERFFHSSWNETIGGRVRFQRPDISPFWFEVIFAASWVSNQGVWSVYGRVTRLFMAVRMKQSADVSDFSGRRGTD